MNPLHVSGPRYLDCNTGLSCEGSAWRTGADRLAACLRCKQTNKGEANVGIKPAVNNSSLGCSGVGRGRVLMGKTSQE